MPLTYATITGTIHFPGSTAGVKCLVTAVPRVQAAGIAGPDGLLYGVVAKPTDSTGALPTGGDALQIPLVDTDTLVWSFYAEPLGPERGGPGNVGLQRWNFYNGPITGSTTLQALADTVNTVVPADFPPSLLSQAQAARDDALAAQAAAEAVGATSDAQQANNTTNGPLTKAALSASFVQAAPFPTGDPSKDGPALTALNEAAAVNGGRIILRASPLGLHYRLNATLVAYPGVQWEGVAPICRQIEKSTGLWLADGMFNFAGGTVLEGDGTFPAFADNNVDLATLPANLGETEIEGFGSVGIGFQNFTYGLHIGAKNTMGLTHSFLDKLYFKDCSKYGAYLVNFAHLTVGDMRMTAKTGNGSEGTFHFGVSLPVVTFQPGNSRFGELYAYIPASSPKTRGIRFHAEGGNGGGSLAHLDAQRIQCNRFATTLISQTATFTSGSANVAVEDGTKYVPGMPVAFTTTVAGFTVDLIYRVSTVTGNTITLAPDSYSSGQAATATGTATMRTYGMPNVEWTIGDAGSTHVAGNFLNVDSEGVVSVGVYAEGATICWFGVGVVTNGCLANIVGRGSPLSQFNVRAAATTDFDGGSSSSSYFGARKATRQFPLRGIWNDETRAANVLGVGNGGNHPTLNKGDLVTRGGGFLYPEFGMGERYFGIDGGVDLYGNEVGNVVFTGTTPITHTLPLLTVDTGALDGCRLGAWYEVQNIGTANVTVQTAGGQLFNNVTGKTSLTVAPQHALRVTAVKTQNGIRTWVAKDTALA